MTITTLLFQHPDRFIPILLAAVLWLTPTISHADRFNLPTDIPVTEDEIYVPARGMTMEEVLKSYGPPIERKSAVGRPPISRWIYENYVVHFESKYVIHSVITN